MSEQQQQEQAAARQAVGELFARQLAARYTLSGVYTYRGEDEAVLFHRVRLDPPPGGTQEKFIRPIHQREGRWRVGEPAAPPRGKALYRLPQLLRADPQRPVYVAEGEKAANALRAIGVLATTSGGAGSAASADWSPLRGRKVRIWPDHDAAGARYGADVAALAIIHAAKVELLEVAGLQLPQKGDAWDWRAANPGAGVAEVEALPWRPWQAPLAPSPGPARKAPPPGDAPRLLTVRAADVQPEKIQWLWPEFIPMGKPTIIAGDPGLGKSMLTASLAAHVSRGRPWPVADSPCPQGGVLLISGEDGMADTIRPRLDAADADVQHVHLLKAVIERDGDRMLCLRRHVQAFGAFLTEHPDVRLVVIDPLTAYMGETDSHKNSEVRALLLPLSALAEQHRIALVLVSHLNKTNGIVPSSASHRISGSVALPAAARAVYEVRKDKHDPARRLMLTAKANLAEDKKGLAYRIVLGANEAPLVEWETEIVRMGADEAQGAEEEDAYDDTGIWLRELLSAGPMPAKQVAVEASRLGIHPRKLQRAAKRAGVEKVREGFGREARYIWRIARPRAGGSAAMGDADAFSQGMSSMSHMSPMGTATGQNVQKV